MRLTTLLENNCHAGSELVAKHGLSLFIETDRQTLLFDTGPDASFAHNAQQLGVDLKKADMLVISHAHYDHGGGLDEFLKINSRAVVYMSFQAQDEYYAPEGDGRFRYIGLDREVLRNHSDRIQFIQEKTEIAPGIKLLPVTEHKAFKPKAILFRKKDGVLVHDNYSHEQIMTIEEQDKLHVLTGCSHNGILNMIQSVKNEYPDKIIHALIGGYHLMNTKTGGLREDEATVCEIGVELLKYDIAQIITGHCTGTRALQILREVLGERIDEMWSGKEFTV